ncbi:helix-turn-helix domain-containing protein [Solicola gregarius]|uniref:AraC family transcriptional regulator n=1 Tax=Solicola gregarius TaxID=2908642 RepID=A0AA46YIR6_9ACTN|nr:AraC family transcriptional regulator [Solicola gregarius]UYM03405.1 AraC family transcriptional regulator [Solicola gregarius]
MRTTRRVVANRHFVVRTVECSDDHARWSPAETTSATQMILVRRGRFRLDTRGRRMTADPTTGYLNQPGQEARFAHPAGGDVCTSITLPGDALTAGVEAVRSPAVRVDARLELAHRALLRTDADPSFAGVEAVVELLRLALRREPDEIPAPGRHDLADRARDALLADEGGTNLVALAHLLETSPSHLSRTFRHHVGMTVSRYRNRVRISRALQRIDDGETNLADLTYALGFSDQAHFTRTMRRELGHTPGRVRALLA